MNSFDETTQSTKGDLYRKAVLLLQYLDSGLIREAVLCGPSQWVPAEPGVWRFVCSLIGFTPDVGQTRLNTEAAREQPWY